MLQQRVTRPRTSPRMSIVLLLILLASTMTACSFGRATPTRTPFPTWTPTPEGQQPAGGGAAVQQPPAEQPPAAEQPVVLPTDTIAPPTPEPLPTDTPEPTATPEPLPTDTPAPTATPEPTATPDFRFTLEAAEKFPTDSLAANVVRIYLYVYSETDFGLPGYTVRVVHNGAELTVDEVTTGGVPEQTRASGGPYTRFANMSVVFVEPQAGRWEIQLLDANRAPVGPPVSFDLTADERTRELYIRYRQGV